MIVTLKDGSKKEYAEAKSVIDIAYDISEGLARAACAGEVNGEVAPDSLQWISVRLLSSMQKTLPVIGPYPQKVVHFGNTRIRQFP